MYNAYAWAYNDREKGDNMELQIKTDSLLKIMEGFPEGRANAPDNDEHLREFITDRDYVLLQALVGIMERLERLHGAVLSLQRNT